ncbi:MAG: DUF1338 domain-containing protein [Myxococcales bacterium]|nr:DUF1338 domain-containing protein [Myxococcales bacterium]
MHPTELLDLLWRDYTTLTPQAARIHALFAARGETIANDHVALRTYDRPGLGLAALARPFEAAGWVRRERYRFDDKHLWAHYWQHPDPALPKVFISELVVDELAPAAAALIDALVASAPAGFGDRAVLATAGRPWSVSHATYRALLEHSEYAAWVAAFGFRVNHFTVDVGRLRTFAGVAEVDEFLLANGFELNRAGGLIKGTPADLLEQSSTCAEPIEVEFSDGRFAVPSCYYEFARRYPLPSGELFQGFVPGSADKLFESTDVRR